MESYSAIKKNSFESILMIWMKLEPIIQCEVSQKDKDNYNTLTHIYGTFFLLKAFSKTRGYSNHQIIQYELYITIGAIESSHSKIKYCLFGKKTHVYNVSLGIIKK